MKEANCLERGTHPTLNEPDDLHRSVEPELIAGLNPAVRYVADSAQRHFGKKNRPTPTTYGVKMVMYNVCVVPTGMSIQT